MTMTPLHQRAPKRRTNKNHPAGSGSKASPQMQSAPVNKPNKVINNHSTGSMTIAGQDQLAFIDNVNTLSDGSIVIDEDITVSSFTRLATQAKGYQRIKWNSLEYTIQSQMPTNTSGGYIAAHIADPSDIISGTEVGRMRLMANKYSVANKAYDSHKMHVRPTQQLLYTSPQGEQRLWSPGKFALIVNGTISQTGSIMVIVKWSVTLSSPTLEDEVVSFRGLTIISPYAGIAKGRPGLYPQDENGSTSSTSTRMDKSCLIQLFGAGVIESLNNGFHYWRMPYNGYPQVQGSATLADIELKILQISVTSQTQMFGTVMTNLRTTVNALGQADTTIYLRGDVFEPINPSDFLNEATRMAVWTVQSPLSRKGPVTFSKKYLQLPQMPLSQSSEPLPTNSTNSSPISTNDSTASSTQV